MKNLAILGSSGSIGRNALWVASRFPEELNVFALSVNTDIALLADQISQFHPRLVCITDPAAFEEFRVASRNCECDILSGQDGLEQIASHPDIDIVLNAVVGFAGLRSTIAAALAGKRIALANKESLVAGGRLVNDILSRTKAEIIPVDSEHSAIFQALHSGRHSEIRKLILTSSGGPFRGTPKEKFAGITPGMALNHPTWNMGRKITIDSATLFNKGLEIIEAAFLFDVSPSNIAVVVHPQSIIHSLVEFIDGSSIAQLSQPDMRLPIQYSFFYPQRRPGDFAGLDYDHSLSLDFFAPDNDKFPSLKLARQALASGGTAPAVLNAANEIAVESFLDNTIKFPHIFQIVEYALNHSTFENDLSIDSIISSDNKAREISLDYIRKLK